MPLRVAINGFGRIGRSILRAKYELLRHPDIQIVAINDTGPAEALAHLLRYDSTYGPFRGQVGLIQGDKPGLKINHDFIQLFHEAQAEHLPWLDLGIDLVLESSGKYRTRQLAGLHLQAGARRVLIAAPAFDPIDRTVVYGVNHGELQADDRIISNASCTTNCVAPLLQAMATQFDIQSGLLTTIHSYSNNQQLIDSVHDDLRRARSATQSLIPTGSGALGALAEVLPAMRGIFTGYSMRVPTLDVAAVDLTLQLATCEKPDTINEVIKQVAARDPCGVLAYTEEPLVSIDFKRQSASATFDSLLTKTAGHQVKLVAWYDNEWAYAHRMLDVSTYLANPVFN